MIKGKKCRTRRKMFISYVIIPITILTVISLLFTMVYFQISRERMLDFENSIAENVDNELKTVMDNLIRSAAQYSMTPWVSRLKYMQKTPEMMNKNITASDISDYASTISLTEINDLFLESIYIYYSIGEFGISSCGKVDWEEYVNIYQIQCKDTAFMSGAMLEQNNQKKIYHNASLMKNGKKISGFFLLQTLPLHNSYSGEVNILFFVPYDNICAYISNLMDEGTEYLLLTDGNRVVYGQQQVKKSMQQDKKSLHPGREITRLKREDKAFFYSNEWKAYVSEYTKQGMDIGIVQILDTDYLNRDFYIFIRWIVMGYLTLTALVLLVARRMADYNYQPLEHIMNMLEQGGQESNEVNEYQIIEKALEELDSQKKRLEITVFEQNPLIEQYILHTLLRSNKPQDNEVKYINTIRQYSFYRCLVLKRSPESRQYRKEMEACLAIYPQLHTAFVEEDHYFIWVISYLDEMLVEEVVDFISQTFTDSEYKDAAVGMSKVHENILHLLSAFNQAVRALEYQFFYHTKKIILLEEDGIEERDKNCADFDIFQQLFQQISEAVENLDCVTLCEAYEQILHYNFCQRQLHKEAYLAGIRKLNGKILNLFEEKKKGKLIEQMELLNPENFASLASYLKTFKLKMEHLMERCETGENPVYYTRNQMIRKYVDEHLTDANMSLSEVAREMHYTPTYFGKYFKEQFGCSFQRYVAERRMESAKLYLEQNKMSIQEIALKCGFTNDVTFRRTFKMYVGMTPSQYDKGGGEDEFH